MTVMLETCAKCAANGKEETCAKCFSLPGREPSQFRIAEVPPLTDKGGSEAVAARWPGRNSSEFCGTCVNRTALFGAQLCSICTVDGARSSRPSHYRHESIAQAFRSEPPHDPVHRPSHYTKGGIECIDAIEAALTPEEFRGYLKGQIMKYNWRLGHKDAPAQEIGKLLWYARRLEGCLEKLAKAAGVCAPRGDGK